MLETLSDDELINVRDYVDMIQNGGVAVVTACEPTAPLEEDGILINRTVSSECDIVKFVKSAVDRHRRAGDTNNGASDSIRKWFRRHRGTDLADSIRPEDLKAIMDLGEFVSDRKEIATSLCKMLQDTTNGLTNDQFVAIIESVELKSMRGDLAEDLLPYLNEKTDRDELLERLGEVVSWSQKDTLEQLLLRPNRF